MFLSFWVVIRCTSESRLMWREVNKSFVLVWCALVTALPWVCHDVHSYLFPNFHTVMWVRMGLHCICIRFSFHFTLRLGSLTETFWWVAWGGREGCYLLRVPLTKRPHTAFSHTHALLCTHLFCFSHVIGIAILVLCWLVFSHEMEDLSHKENSTERSSLVVLVYSRKEKPGSSVQ